MNTTIETTLTQKYFQNSTIHFMVYAGFSHLTLIGLTFKYVLTAAKQRLSGLVIRYSRNSFGLGLAFWKKERVTFGWVLALFFVLCFRNKIKKMLLRFKFR
jgi:hypothetical protein